MPRDRDIESGPGPGAFTLSPRQAEELWLWLRNGLRTCREERLALPGRQLGALAGPEAARLAREEHGWRRVGLAFEHCFEDHGSHLHGIQDVWPDRLGRGLDATGVALFSCFLEEQVRWWREHAEAPAPSRRARLRIYQASSAVFHRLVGAPEVAVRRRARQHSFGPDCRHRTFKWGVGGREPGDQADAPGVDERWRRVLRAWHRRPGVQPFATARRQPSP